VSDRGRRVAVGIGVVAVLALDVFGLLALARGAGSQAATGNVVSITDAATGKVVCVRDAQSHRTRCGEVSDDDLPERLESVGVGDCAFIKVARGAVLDLERRPC